MKRRNWQKKAGQQRRRAAASDEEGRGNGHGQAPGPEGDAQRLQESAEGDLRMGGQMDGTARHPNVAPALGRAGLQGWGLTGVLPERLATTTGEDRRQTRSRQGPRREQGRSP